MINSLFRSSEKADLEYSVLSNQVILDNIMRHFTYKDVQRLSKCCRAFKELSTFEFKRRRYGTVMNFLLFRSKYFISPLFVRHPKTGREAFIHVSVESAQRELVNEIEQLSFRPKVALTFIGNVKIGEHRKWCSWLKQQLPNDCVSVNVLSRTAVSGSIDENVYEMHRNRDVNSCGVAYLLLGEQRPSQNIQVFKTLKELVNLTEGSQDEPVKCILYFSRTHSRKQLLKILSVSKERNNNLNIAFGGLAVDSLASSNDECAGLVFSGSEVNAASTIIGGELTNDEIRKSMILFRDSLSFDINDRTKNTICFLLSCVEHFTWEAETETESDIFHSVFPSNVKAFGISGNGEFGQISGVAKEKQSITYQFSCIMVLVQFPMK